MLTPTQAGTDTPARSGATASRGLGLRVLLPSLLALVLCVLFAAYRQGATGFRSLSGDLAYGDDPAYFVTSVLLRDYLATWPPTAPMPFAESFYVRYPKVALGHWPPVYPDALAVWFGLWGTSIVAAQCLSAAVAALLAGRQVVRFRHAYPWLLVVAGAAVFLSLPLVLAFSWRVMAELLLTLLVTSALWAFGDFLERGQRKAAVCFTLFAAAAILTKGSAWALGIAAVLGPLCARRTSAFRHPAYWLSGVAIVLLAGCWYLPLALAGLSYADSPAQVMAQAGTGTRLSALAVVLRIAPLPILALALWGAVVAARRRWTSDSSHPADTHVVLAAVWLASQVLFISVFPMTLEWRYFLPSLPGICLALTAGLADLHARLTARFFPSAWVAACLAGAVLLACVPARRADVRHGYQAAVDAIPYEASGPLILVSGGPMAEGALIAGRLAHDPGRASVMLRASKLLAVSTWSGSRYTALAGSKEEVLRALDNASARYVMVDEASATDLHDRLLHDTVRDTPTRFRLHARVPVTNADRAPQGWVSIYEDTTVRTLPAVVRVALSPERGARKLQLRLHHSGPSSEHVAPGQSHP